MTVQRPSSLSVPAAGEPGMWTSQGDAEVKLRMGDSGLAAETPLTVNQMFTSAVERFGDFTALGWKDGEQQKSMNYREYYQACRTAAKSFLKVGQQNLNSINIETEKKVFLSSLDTYKRIKTVVADCTFLTALLMKNGK